MENLRQVTVTPIARERAVTAFARCMGLDPQGVETPHSAANAGQCFQVSAPSGTMVYSAGIKGGALWCFAAAGEGAGMAQKGLAVLERQARANGCTSVQFQTLRAGLVRVARRNGYSIARSIGAGFVLSKAIQ